MAKADGPRKPQQETLAVDELFPNPWNVNSMTPAKFEKLKESIKRYGMPLPIVVRPHPWEQGRWQIVDGEHRWRAAKTLGWDDVPCMITDFDEATAKEAGIVVNDLHGEADEAKLSALLQELAQETSTEELREIMPYDSTRLDELLGELKEVDYERLTSPGGQEDKPEVYVERVFRMPREVAVVIDEAVAKVRDEQMFEHDWQALEVMAADTMAS